MKVLINTCYGGFGLSDEFEQEFNKRHPTKRFGYTDESIAEFNKRYPGKNINDNYCNLDENEEHKEIHIFLCSLKVRSPDDNWVRTDPDIIALVEEFGTERSSGTYAKICVEEIPDDVEFKIREYDGSETLEWSLPKDKIIQDLIDVIKGRKKEDETCKFTQELLKNK